VNCYSRCAPFAAVVVCLLAAATVRGQSGPQFKDWNFPLDEVRVKPRLACADLRSLTGFEFSIVTANTIAATADAPEHCRVSGQILPEIRFEVDLPASWNRRFYMFGNGGFAGEPFEAPPRIAQRNLALQRGFAVASTNTGHDAASEPLATFATNRQKLIDFGFRSVHATAETAKELIRSYYKDAQSQSYFDGCSTGGRQGLISAQRFPEDFDGILVGAPILDLSGTMISGVWIARALAEAPIPSAKLKTLAERVYARCDEKDGLKDGLIDDPRQCDFLPSRDLPKCSADSDGPECFTAKQIAALEQIYADVRSQGKPIFPGWPVSGEVDGPNPFIGGSNVHGPGWVPWLINDNGPTYSVEYTETFFRYMAFPEPDPKFDLAHFNFDKDPARMTWIRQVMDATDTDLSRFQSRGGKIIMYHGWADPALNPRMSVEYYKKVADRMGSTTNNFFRLFMVPGMFHCGAGVGVSRFDAMTPLVTWVEKGVEPDHITGTKFVEGKTVRTRPLCPYPQVAKYKGTGSTDDGVNFACRLQ
jgi:tannase/feruloyl esterase